MVKLSKYILIKYFDLIGKRTAWQTQQERSQSNYSGSLQATWIIR